MKTISTLLISLASAALYAQPAATPPAAPAPVPSQILQPSTPGSVGSPSVSGSAVSAPSVTGSSVSAPSVTGSSVSGTQVNEPSRPTQVLSGPNATPAATSGGALSGATITTPSGDVPGVNDPAGAPSTGDQAVAGFRQSQQQVLSQQLQSAVTAGGTSSIFLPQSGSVVTVTSTDGIVRVDGIVRTEAERNALNNLLRRLDNVTSLQNEVRVQSVVPRPADILETPAPVSPAP